MPLFYAYSVSGYFSECPLEKCKTGRITLLVHRAENGYDFYLAQENYDTMK